MPTKRKELSDLQRDLLQLALQGPKAKIWLPKASQQSFPTTYAAVVSLQRRGLLDAEQAKDPEILTWKVTKEGREALKAPKAQQSPREQAPPPPAASGGSTSKASVSPMATPKRSSPPAPASAPEPRNRGVKGKEAVPATKSSRGSRATPAAPAEAPRERGAKGKAAVPAASPTRSAGQKVVSVPKKSGGRGRT